MARGGKTGTIKGNPRDNVLDGTEIDNTILGRGGNDILNGYGGNDLLDGGADDDTLNGGLGDDTLLGGTGNDLLDGGEGSDQIDGGDGDDTAVFAGLRSDYQVIQIDATTVQLIASDGSIDTVTNVETFVFDDVTEDFTVLVTEPNLTTGTLTLTDTVLVEGGPTLADWSVAATGSRTADPSSTVLVIATAPNEGAIVGTVASDSVGTLTDGETAIFNSQLDLSGLAAGTYYIAAIADYGDVVAEGDETDNVSNWIAVTVEERVTEFAISADLLLSSADHTNGDGFVAAAITIENNGNDWANQDGQLFVYLSSDTAVSADDVQLLQSTVSLEPGQSIELREALYLPADLVGGDYHIVVVFEAAGSETDVTNNTVFTEQVWIWDGKVHGTSGDDVLVGTSLDEEIFGYEGNDTFIFSDGMDKIYGGEGTDTLDLSQNATGLSLYYAPTLESPDRLVNRDDQGAIQTEISGVENFVGSDFDDTILLFPTDEISISTTTMDGGAGNDILGGSAGNDTLIGGTGDDFLVGYKGDDMLFLGSGADSIGFIRTMQDGITSGDGHDSVADFDVTEDTIFVAYNAALDPILDPLSLFIQTVDGALFNYADDSSVLLTGVDVSDLTIDNIFLSDNPMATA